jgi:DNA-binding CsgD family transcriptional regulator
LQYLSSNRRPFLRARTLMDRGSLMRRQKARADAKVDLLDARAVFEQLGAVPWLTRCDAELDKLGGHQDGNELTPSEQQMAERACRGQSNQEIANEMFVSLRTVESTLTRVYRKLGVRSRAQMIAQQAGR